MSRELQKVDYAGRTVDLLLLKTVLYVPVANKRVELDVSNVVDEPMIVSGIEKMVQRFVIMFVNAAGSTKFREDHGTGLVPDVAKGLVYDMSTLEAEAAEANLIAGRQMILSVEGEDTPDDERFASSEVVGLDFSREKSTVMISIRLTTAAGRSYVYIIPVDIGVH
jgi:hypothetical protein